MKPLVPQGSVWVRGAAVIILFSWLFAVIQSWSASLIIGLALTAIFGTFSRAQINLNSFERQWFALFVPVHLRRVSIGAAIRIETDVEERMSWETSGAMLLFMDVRDLLWTWILDRFFWGDYKLWLRLASDERILVWQGNGERNFRRNLETLEEVLGLPVTRG